MVAPNGLVTPNGLVANGDLVAPGGICAVEPPGPMYMPINLLYPGLTKVCQRPPIYTIENFLSHEECDQLIHSAGPLLQRSKTHAVSGMRVAPQWDAPGALPPRASALCCASAALTSCSCTAPWRSRERGDEGENKPHLSHGQEPTSVPAAPRKDPSAHRQAVWSHGASTGCTLHR